MDNTKLAGATIGFAVVGALAVALTQVEGIGIPRNTAMAVVAGVMLMVIALVILRA